MCCRRIFGLPAASVRPGLVMQRDDFTGQLLDANQRVVQRAGEIQCGNFQPLAAVPDAIFPRLRLVPRVDQQAAGQVESCGVGE